MGNETRQRTCQIMIRVTPEENNDIQTEADKYSLSRAAYLRNLGLGFEPRSTVDNQAVVQISKLRGDLGKVGGLLKMALDTPAAVERDQHRIIRELINRLSELREEIGATIEAL